MFSIELINNLNFSLKEVFPETFLKIQKDNIQIFLTKEDRKNRKIKGLITKGKKYFYFYIFKNNKKIKKIKFIDYSKIDLYLKIIKELLDSEGKIIPKKKFDLNTFLRNLKNDLKIDEIYSIYIYFGINENDMKSFSIKYFGDEPLLNVIDYISKYFKIIEKNVKIPLEIYF